ncbi:MAG: rod shape-determining protein MreC [Verrucomicrobiales bacterium]|nr:rod shape-determining protein MreC [Verrucomicrobiales bacterium]
MSRFNLIALILLIGAVVWVFFFSPETVENIQRGALAMVGTVRKAGGHVQDQITGVPDPLDSLSPRELRGRIREMERDEGKMRLELDKFDDLIEENNSLRQSLNYVRNSPLQLVPARVVKRTSDTWYNTLDIDKGLEDKIVIDSPVIVPVQDQAGLVGKIISVGDKISTVLLLCDEMCPAAARVEGSTEQGILYGVRGSLRSQPDLTLRYLSKDAVIEPGRFVITSGVGGVFPPNLLLGTVKEFKQSAISGEAVVAPAADFTLLRYVYVVMGER